MKGFADLADLPEDDRIALIAEAVEHTAGMVGFVVDDDAKADRYIRKPGAYPKVRVIDRSAGPVKGSVLVRIGQRGH